MQAKVGEMTGLKCDKCYIWYNINVMLMDC